MSLIGSVLDKYEVLQKVGEGGMATVYRGRHVTLGREVAIKVLHPHLSSSLRNRQRFAREARAIEYLRHPSILEIFDYSGENSPDSYIITEFVHGETLTDLLVRGGQLPSELVAIIGRALAGALGFAHRSGILHRDVKPDNVMIRNDGVVKLMDFGIARFLDEVQVTMTGALVGSPAYMSPEQARETDLDARSDLFSLGVLLFQMVAGQVPFHGSNPSVILKKIIEGSHPSVSDLVPAISPMLADTIERLMQTDREARFVRAEDVREALSEVLRETSLDEAHPDWSLHAYLVDAADYGRRLDARLRIGLLERGKALLASGDSLGAMRVFNRLLSIDESQAEVLALVQGLGMAEDRLPAPEVVVPREPMRPLLAGLRQPLWVGGLVIGALAASTAAWTLFDQQPPAPVSAPSPIENVSLNVRLSEEGEPTDRPSGMAAGPSVTEVTSDTFEQLPNSKTGGVATRRSPIGTMKSGASAVVSPSFKVTEEIVVTAASPVTGLVTFKVAGEGWADVYCEQRRVGKTRPPDNQVSFSAGRHRCRYSSPYILDEEVEFTVNPGDMQTVAVAVRWRPIMVLIDSACPDECVVSRDGERLGSIATVGRRIELESPNRPQTLVLNCDGAEYRQVYDGSTRPFFCGQP